MIPKLRLLLLAIMLAVSSLAMAQPILVYASNFTDPSGETYSMCTNNLGDPLPIDMVVWAIEDSLNNGIAPVGPDGMPTGDDKPRMFFRMGEGAAEPGLFYASLTAFNPNEFTPGTLTAGRQFYLRAFTTMDTTLPPPPGTYYATSTLAGGVLPIVPNIFGSDVFGFTWPTAMTLQTGGITSITPNGGESWSVGTQQTISWNTVGVTGNVTIALNRDFPNGAWTNLATVPVSPGIFNWTVTGPASATARVRITSVSTPSLSRISAANFQITAPGIIVTSPNGGESLVVGTNSNITWTTQDIMGNVQIQLNRSYPSGTWENLFASTSNDFSETWAVTGPNTTNARVRILSVTNPTVGDTSNSNFTITSPSVTVTAPNGGNIWTINQSESFTWTSQFVTGNVRVEINRDFPGGIWSTIYANIPNDGIEVWNPTGPATTNARIRISSVNDPTILDISDANFTIRAPVLTVAIPNGGENWIMGTSYNISWTADTTFNGNVNVQVNRNFPSGTWVNIATNVHHDSSTNWIATGPATNAARVRVIAAFDTSINDISNANFSIVSPAITVNNPNGGNTLIIGTNHTITWSSQFLAGNVQIQLNRSYPSASWVDLFANTANDTNEVWAVTGPATTTARIRILSVNNPAIGDTSDANFTITPPTITVTSPNGGETWTMNQSRVITWTSQAVTGNVRVELNRNFPSGAWTTLFANLTNDGSESWTVTGPVTTTARVRLVAIADTSINDVSNANFIIRAPVVTVTSPNGGENWAIGSQRNITWTVDTTFVGNVHVQLNRLYPSGTWTNLFTNVPNNTPVNWTVTGPATEDARIRVVAVFDTSVSDISNADFSISTPTLTVLFPNGGDTLFVGSSYMIRWSRQLVTGTVEVHINREFPTGNWEYINNSVSDSLLWEITQPSANIARIRVRSTMDTSISDVSNANFMIFENSVTERFSGIPTEFTLEKAFPNPFNSTTTLMVGVPKNAEVRVSVFNMLGQKVATLYSGRLNAGYHPIVWNAQSIASGLYIVQLETSGIVKYTRVNFLR